MIATFLTTGAVLLRIFSNPLGNVFQKQLTKDNHPLLINFLTYLLLSFFCLFIVVNMQWQELPRQFWIYSVLGGIAGAFGNGFLVKALQTGEDNFSVFRYTGFCELVLVWSAVFVYSPVYLPPQSEKANQESRPLKCKEILLSDHLRRDDAVFYQLHLRSYAGWICLIALSTFYDRQRAAWTPAFPGKRYS